MLAAARSVEPDPQEVREFCIAGGYSFYNPREHAG